MAAEAVGFVHQRAEGEVDRIWQAVQGDTAEPVAWGDTEVMVGPLVWEDIVAGGEHVLVGEDTEDMAAPAAREDIGDMGKPVAGEEHIFAGEDIVDTVDPDTWEDTADMVGRGDTEKKAAEHTEDKKAGNSPGRDRAAEPDIWGPVAGASAPCFSCACRDSGTR